MTITWDEAKRRLTLSKRNLDFADAGTVFDGLHYTRPDERRDYGEPRYITAGYVKERFVVIVWTPRDDGRRIISMRHGHAEEEERFKASLGRPG